MIMPNSKLKPLPIQPPITHLSKGVGSMLTSHETSHTKWIMQGMDEDKKK